MVCPNNSTFLPRRYPFYNITSHFPHSYTLTHQWCQSKVLPWTTRSNLEFKVLPKDTLILATHVLLSPASSLHSWRRSLITCPSSFSSTGDLTLAFVSAVNGYLDWGRALWLSGSTSYLFLAHVIGVTNCPGLPSVHTLFLVYISS